jgi:hypothetical protein
MTKQRLHSFDVRAPGNQAGCQTMSQDMKPKLVLVFLLDNPSADGSSFDVVGD